MRTKTGIFFTYFQGERLKDFPRVLTGILEKENVSYYDAIYKSHDGLFYLKPLPKALLIKVHSPEMLESVKMTGDYESALYSAGRTIQASAEIRQRNIDNAFVFTAFGDHHAERNDYGGMCYFNDAALAISALKAEGVKRFAIVDTDCHHGDGTKDIFGSDKTVLHICFYHRDYSDDWNNVDVLIPQRTSDEEYLSKMRRDIIHRITSFQPSIFSGSSAMMLLRVSTETKA